MEEIYLNSISDDQREIIRLIGFKNFIILCEYFNGENVYFPKLSSAKIQERNKKILLDFKSGINVNILARKYNICDRQVRRIIKKK